MYLRIIVLFLSLSLSHSVFADEMDDIALWTTNYLDMLTKFENTNAIGDCNISLSEDPQLPPDSKVLNIITQANGLSTFFLTSPKETLGRTQISFIQPNIFHYRESDLAGWVNMYVYLTDDLLAVRGLNFNKSLPNGDIYSQGSTCGDIN